MAEQEEKLRNKQNKRKNKSAFVAGKNNDLKDFLNGDDDVMFDDEDIVTSKPIADLFPETTILFSDLVGFTAWSSMREPSQVFVLLETLFRAFDKVAKRR